MSTPERPTTETRLFSTSAELGAPPVSLWDGDLSRIRVFTDATDPEWLAYCERRAERVTTQDQQTVAIGTRRAVTA